MSKACSSPTARLLQNSRLFSVPKPLPVPIVSSSILAGGLHRTSDTATTPYPTHQAIDAPQSSRAIGEWGLKRHLPLRTTVKSKTPIRILAQDTNDHVTDFASAGDHTISLKKFQELGIPVFKREPKTSSYYTKSNVSVYEDSLDITDRTQNVSLRWKNNGPYLLGMEAIDFDRFLEELKGQKSEWQQHLREYCAQRTFENEKETALKERGIFGPVELKPLAVQRDHIIPEAEREVRALQEANPGESQEMESRYRQIMEDAQQRADQCETDLERQTQHLDAIDYLRNADDRASNIIKFVEDRTRQRYQDLEEQGHPTPQKIEQAKADADKSMEEARAQAADIHAEAYDQVIRRFGEEPDQDPARHEAHARQLTADAYNAIIAADAERLARTQKWELAAKKSFIPDDQKLEEFQKELRDAHVADKTHSELTGVLIAFLDLPGMGGSDSRSAQMARAAKLSQTSGLRAELVQFMDTQTNDMPLSTHPGAGLGYLRSSLHMENHPIYGPQAQRSPVLARVIQPRTSASGNSNFAKLGVAGFVAEDNKIASGSLRMDLPSDHPDVMAKTLDPYLVGGNKMYMRAQSANVDEAGRVTLQLFRPDKEAVAVKTGKVEEILANKKATLEGSFPSLPSLYPDRPSGGYGLQRSPRRT